MSRPHTVAGSGAAVRGQRKRVPTVVLGIARAVPVAAIGLSVSACAIADSTQVAPLGTPTALTCRSDLGPYAIPKSYLGVTISKPSGTASGPYDVDPTGSSPQISVVRHPDPAFTYCLAYHPTPFAQDQVKIIKAPVVATTGAYGGTGGAGAAEAADATPSNPTHKTEFLNYVLVNATDQTVYIFEALAKAAVTAALRALPAKSTPEQATYEEWDPFDQFESAVHNERLRKFGYCVVLESYSHPIGVSDESYCNAPSRYAQRTNLYQERYSEYETQGPPKPNPGIVYKPRQDYRIFVYHKRDPGGGSPWMLQYATHFAMENISPVLSLDIDRAYFAGRRSYFAFDNGDLTTACVAKQSELLGLSQIPVSITASLVALPTQILQLRYQNTLDTTELANINSQVLANQQYLVQKLNGTSNLTSPGAVQSAPSVVLPSTLFDPTKYNAANPNLPQLNSPTQALPIGDPNSPDVNFFQTLKSGSGICRDPSPS